jgi:hypothetical protein
MELAILTNSTPGRLFLISESQHDLMMANV